MYEMLSAGLGALASGATGSLPVACTQLRVQLQVWAVGNSAKSLADTSQWELT
jgi:hypothetical protein